MPWRKTSLNRFIKEEFLMICCSGGNSAWLALAVSSSIWEWLKSIFTKCAHHCKTHKTMTLVCFTATGPGGSVYQTHLLEFLSEKRSKVHFKKMSLQQQSKKQLKWILTLRNRKIFLLQKDGTKKLRIVVCFRLSRYCRYTECVIGHKVIGSISVINVEMHYSHLFQCVCSFFTVFYTAWKTKCLTFMVKCLCYRAFHLLVGPWKEKVAHFSPAGFTLPWKCGSDLWKVGGVSDRPLSSLIQNEEPCST